MSEKKIMKENISDGGFFGTEKIGKILMKITPPVMLAQLIQALYNIVDSFLWENIRMKHLRRLLLFILYS